MVGLQVAESLWVHLPYFEQYSIPATSFWTFVGSLIVGLLSLAGSMAIAYFVYRLARHQFRSNRWWERQERRYSAAVNELVTIRDATHKLALYDYPDSYDDPGPKILYTAEEREQFRKEISEAQAAIKKEIHRGVFLLSPRAIRALQDYVWKVEAIDRENETYPDGFASGLVNHAYDEFYDIAQRDLHAPGLWLAHRKAGYDALRDRLDRLWLPWTPERLEDLSRLRALRRMYRERQGGRLQGESELSYRLHATLTALRRFVKDLLRPS